MSFGDICQSFPTAAGRVLVTATDNSGCARAGVGWGINGHPLRDASLAVSQVGKQWHPPAVLLQDPGQSPRDLRPNILSPALNGDV